MRHLTENLFDKLRNGEMKLTTDLMDTIMAPRRRQKHVRRVGAGDSAMPAGRRLSAPCALLEGEHAEPAPVRPPAPPSPALMRRRLPVPPER